MHRYTRACSRAHFSALRWWNVTVPRGCLSDGDRFDGLTGLLQLFLLFRDALYVRACLRAFWLRCVLSLTEAGLWEMPAYRAALNQTHIGSDTAEPAVWQACDRAELVLNDFLGSITLPKHQTRHLLFPISPSWSQTPLLFTNVALIAPYICSVFLITYRWKLARTKIIHPLCCKSKREVEQGAECQEPASSSGDYPAGSIRCWYLHCHSTLWCFDTGGL